MSRWWTELVATVGDVIPLPVLVLLLFAAAALVGLLWYFFPRWVPRRWPRIRLRLPAWLRHRPRLRWRLPRWRLPRLGRRQRRTKPPAAPPTVAGPAPDEGEGLPAMSAEAFASLADRLAAEGRYAEAVRERLRAVVRDLVTYGLIVHRPGWTVTELAAEATRVRADLSGPVGNAADLFSAIWYGRQPAGSADDHRMRGYASAVTALLGGTAPPATAGPGRSPAHTTAGGDR